MGLLTVSVLPWQRCPPDRTRRTERKRVDVVVVVGVDVDVDAPLEGFTAIASIGEGRNCLTVIVEAVLTGGRELRMRINSERVLEEDRRHRSRSVVVVCVVSVTSVAAVGGPHVMTRRVHVLNLGRTMTRVGRLCRFLGNNSSSVGVCAPLDFCFCLQFLFFWNTKKQKTKHKEEGPTKFGNVGVVDHLL